MGCARATNESSNRAGLRGRVRAAARRMAAALGGLLAENEAAPRPLVTRLEGATAASAAVVLGVQLRARVDRLQPEPSASWMAFAPAPGRAAVSQTVLFFFAPRCEASTLCLARGPSTARAVCVVDGVCASGAPRQTLPCSFAPSASSLPRIA